MTTHRRGVALTPMETRPDIIVRTAQLAEELGLRDVRRARGLGTGLHPHGDRGRPAHATNHGRVRRPLRLGTLSGHDRDDRRDAVEAIRAANPRPGPAHGSVPGDAQVVLDQFTAYGTPAQVRDSLERWQGAVDILMIGVPPGLSWPAIEATLRAAAP